MRRWMTLVFVISVVPSAFAQSAAAPVEGVSAGLYVAPALDTTDFWFFSGVRASVPLGGRRMLDIEAARIDGSANIFSEITSRFGAQVRFLKSPDDPEGRSRYWLAGFHLMKGKKFDGEGGFLERRNYPALTFGYGARRIHRNGLLVFGELGASVTSGLVLFASTGLQWGPRATRR